MSTDAHAAFLRRTGREPEGVWSAPGRVNLIGEHTDHSEGVVLPFALPLRATVAAARRDDGRLSVRSCQQPGEAAVALDPLTARDPVQGWAAYVVGVIWSLAEAGHHVGGLDLVIDSDVPQGAGLSSSAAIECAVALAAHDIFDIDLPTQELAARAQHAENEYVGVPCGLMDQMVSMLATAGHALLFDTRSGLTEQVPFDPSAAALRLLVIDTHTRHAHAGGGYADRRRACAEAAARLGVRSLREVTMEGLDDALVALGDSPIPGRRLRHVVTENARALETVALLRAGRVAEIGPLLDASHASLRDDFEVSSVELDTAVAAARAAGALGARMTGGGFGGCAIALVEEVRAAAVLESVVSAAQQRGLTMPTAMPGIPSAGAHRDR